jgi:hypothetical protein
MKGKWSASNSRGILSINIFLSNFTKEKSMNFKTSSKDKPPLMNWKGSSYHC